MGPPSNLFVEFHALVSYAPSNLNRDDLGSPKTAIFGGHRRLRVSSQCLKRTWRMSEAFRGEFAEAQLGLRTQRVGAALRERLPGLDRRGAEQLNALLGALGRKGAAGKRASEAEGAAGKRAGEAEGAAGKKGEVEGDAEGADEGAGGAGAEGGGETKHLLFVSRAELDAMAAYVREGLAKKKKLDPKELEEHVRRACDRNAVDVALFGRFLTTADRGKSAFTTDAALQVAHGLGTHKVDLEYDFYSAVDDLSGGAAGHIGEVEFASSVVYLYAVCDLALLRRNLGADAGCAGGALAAVARAMARTAPAGKKNGTAPHSPADYLGVVVRRDAPVSLANAFLAPVRPEGGDAMSNSVRALRRQARRYDEAYGADGVVGRTTLCLCDGVAEPGEREELVGSLDALTRLLGEQIEAGGAP